MCLIVLAWRARADLPLAVAANRDEWRDRPAEPARWWPDSPGLLAGRDLKAGGTWMGLTRSGRFAAVTNFRDPADKRSTALSRGALVTDFLLSAESPRAFLERLRGRARDYNGFNLILGDAAGIYWFSNRAGADPRNGKPLEPGIYGVSNGLLDAPWPKVVRTKATFASLLLQGAPEEAYFEMLADTTRAPDMRLPDTGVPLDLERELSAVCIEIPGYGTRTSTVVKVYADAEPELHERVLKPGDQVTG